MDRNVLELFWRMRAVVVSPEPITLKAGRTSHVYVNFRPVVSAPDNLRAILNLLGDLAGMRAGGMAVGNVPSLLSPVLAGAAAARFSLPLVLYRPGQEEKGVAGSVFAAETARSQPLVLVDDVLSSGGTVRSALRDLAAAGLADVRVCILVDKRPRSLRQGDDLRVDAAADLASLLEYGIEAGHVAADLASYVREEIRFQEG